MHTYQQPKSPFIALRLLLWSVLLVLIALGVQRVIDDHLTRTRGITPGFPQPIDDAHVPLLGINVDLEQYDDAGLAAALAQIEAGGFTWVRQSFDWHHIEPAPGQYAWQESDRLMAALQAFPQLRLVAVLGDDPATPPQDPARFAAFAAAFAARYGDQVDDYQVWDEPNLAAQWGGGPVSPPAYADLLAHTATAIRHADPGARILLAGLAPTTEAGPQNLSDLRYLAQLYQAGAAPYFDIVAGKPYGFDSGPDDRRASEDLLNFSRLLLLRQVMVEHDDASTALWASHWGWNALPPDWEGAPSVWGQCDPTTQAAYTLAALERAQAEWPWMGAMMLEHYQPDVPADDPHWGFALIDPAGTPRPLYDALAAWAAAQPDAASPGCYPAATPYATYHGAWQTGPLGADIGATGDRATFDFSGTAVALTVRRGPYRAFLHVTVDGQPANALPQDNEGNAYVVLFDTTPTIVTVPLAEDLRPGPHTVEITAQEGQQQWALVDWRVGVDPQRDGFVWKILTLILTGGLGLYALLHDAQRVNWAALGRYIQAWPWWAQASAGAGLTALLWVAAAQSWGHAWHSPWLVVSLVTLPLLGGLFALRPVLGLALVAATAPFYLQPTTMIYGALSLPHTLLLLCATGQIATLRSKKAYRRISLLDIAIMALLLAALLATVAAANTAAALFDLGSVLIAPTLYYLLLKRCCPDRISCQRILNGFIAGATGVALIGLIQYALGINLVTAEGGLPRLQSVYFSPNHVGLYLGRAWPFLVALAILEKNKRRRTVYILALVPVTLAIGLSFSRGALLFGLPATVLAMGWRAGKRWRWAALIVIIVGILALIPLMRIPRFAALLDMEQGSTFFRLELWRSSMTMIRENPLLGVGPGNFQDAYRTRYVLPSAWEEFNLEHPHNIYLDHWLRLGFFGLLAGIVIQVAFWLAVHRWPRRDALALGLSGAMAALLAHGLVDNALFFPDLALVFFMMLALVTPQQSNKDITQTVE